MKLSPRSPVPPTKLWTELLCLALFAARGFAGAGAAFQQGEPWAFDDLTARAETGDGGASAPSPRTARTGGGVFQGTKK